MTQKNCENEIRELNRDQQEMLDEHIDRLNKVFKGKDNYAGIAVMSENMHLLSAKTRKLIRSMKFR